MGEGILRIEFGMFKGEVLETVVLKESFYIEWFLQNIGDQKAQLNAEILRLLRRFDQKELLETCMGRRCSELATHMTVYESNLSPHWWCDSCSAYQEGAVDGKLSYIRTYRDVLNHVRFYCDGNKKKVKKLVLDLARAKGLPDRVNDAAAIRFFE